MVSVPSLVVPPSMAGVSRTRPADSAAASASVALAACPLRVMALLSSGSALNDGAADRRLIVRVPESVTLFAAEPAIATSSVAGLPVAVILPAVVK